MYKILKNTKTDSSEIELEVEIETTLIESKWGEAVKHLGEHATIDGFRKGHVPENIILQKFGEMTILEEATELSIKKIYQNILEDLNIDPLTYPTIAITKIARNNPVVCQIKIPVMPEIKLPDYKSIAKKENKTEEKVEVEEKEVDLVITELKKQKTDETVSDDDFAKTLGDFKDFADLKAKIKENIEHEKKHKAKQKKRLELLDEINKKIEVKFPEVLIEAELDRMTKEFSHEIEKVGSTLDAYLKEIKKTNEEMRAEWREKAIERILSEFVLMEISKKENLKPDPKEIEEEVHHLKEHYKETDEQRIQMFVEEVLMKEKVFKFLEEQK